MEKKTRLKENNKQKDSRRIKKNLNEKQKLDIRLK